MTVLGAIERFLSPRLVTVSGTSAGARRVGSGRPRLTGSGGHSQPDGLTGDTDRRVGKRVGRAGAAAVAAGRG